jgi:hypothetical protein
MSLVRNTLYAAAIVVSGHAAYAIDMPVSAGDRAVVRVKSCASHLTIRAPVGKVTLNDSERDTRKVIQCGRPLAEYLFSNGVGAAESVDYANWFAFASQAFGQFQTKAASYQADTRLISMINDKCGRLGKLDCVYDYLKDTAVRGDEEGN